MILEKLFKWKAIPLLSLNKIKKILTPAPVIEGQEPIVTTEEINFLIWFNTCPELKELLRIRALATEGMWEGYKLLGYNDLEEQKVFYTARKKLLQVFKDKFQEPKKATIANELEVTMGLTTDRSDPGLNKHLPNGQQEKYLVLSEEERNRGYVRPVRTEYIHLACNTITTMNQQISETYARDPKFYGGTFCVGCGKHFPLIKEDGTHAFEWIVDNQPVGS